MPRQARIQSQSNYYHIMMRGNNRENIFNWEEQKCFFIELLEIQKEDGLLEIVAYCLMDNHVHIIVKSELNNIATAIKTTNIKYAMKFNRQLGRIGHVFQDRYKSEAINDENYLLQVIRYVHNNPVKAKIVSMPADYRWSSYNEYINSTKIISHQQKEFILGYFSDNLRQFEIFHSEKDNNEYLEIKEDLDKIKLEQAQEIISTTYCQESGLIENKEIFQNPQFLKKIIKELLKNSKLSHRQIANLVGVSNSVVHKISLHKISVEK